MAGEREIQIVITAKNLSDAELAKARAAIAGFKKDSEGATGSTSGFGGALRNATGLAGAFGVTLGVAAVVKFGKALLDDADALVKLADKTGMSTDAVQKLKYIADQSGNTLEQLTSAVSMLQKRLANGEDSAIAALRGLGIEVEQFQRLTPDEQFMAIAREVAKIEDPMQRVKVATDLLGKSGAEVLPSLIAKVDELAAKAPVMSQKTVQAFDAIGDALSGMWARTKNAVGEGLGTMFDSYGRLVSGVSQTLKGEFLEAAATLAGLQSELPKVRGRAGTPATAPISVALSMDEANTVGKELTETTKEQAKANEASARSFKAVRAELDQIESGFHDAGVAVWEFGKRFDDAAMGPVLARLDEIEGRAEKITQDFWEMGRALPAEMPPAWGPIPGLPRIAQWTGGGFALIREETKTSLTAGLGAAFAAFPTLMMQSLTGGGGVSGAFSAFGSQIGSTLGKSVGSSLAKSVGGMFGKVLGDLIPGLGAMLGPAVEWLGSKLLKTEGKKVNDLRDAFINAAGGLADLNSQAAAAGTTLDALLRAKTVKEYEAAVASLNAKLAQTAAIQGELAGLQQQLADRQKMNWQTAEELATKYGGTLGTLGQQFVAAKQQASFKEVWDDWQTLIDMGADVGGVLVSMKDEIGALVGESLRIGTEIPEQFKPLIEELIRTGQLFTDTGEQITDISTLTFGAPLVSATDALITKINELIETLKNGLTPAINAIPSRVHVKVGYDLEDFPELPGYAPPAYASGAVITAPHLAMVGEGGQPELIGPVGFMAEALAGAFASMGLGGGRSSDRLVVENHVHVIARNGRELAEVVAPELPDALSRYGIKVR